MPSGFNQRASHRQGEQQVHVKSAGLTAPLVPAHDSPLFLVFAASGCRFYCRFWMPLPVAVWQSKILSW